MGWGNQFCYFDLNGKESKYHISFIDEQFIIENNIPFFLKLKNSNKKFCRLYIDYNEISMVKTCFYIIKDLEKNKGVPLLIGTNIENELKRKKLNQKPKIKVLQKLFNDGERKECGRCHEIKLYSHFVLRRDKLKPYPKSTCKRCELIIKQIYSLSNKYKEIIQGKEIDSNTTNKEIHQYVKIKI